MLDNPGPLRTWAPWGFYSPGLACPSGWTTATSLSHGMVTTGSLDVRLYSAVPLLVEGEAAAFCCPEDYSIDREHVIQWPPGPHCLSVDPRREYRMVGCNQQTWTQTFTDDPSDSQTWLSVAPALQLISVAVN
jgi:hypothetical protein